MDGSSDILLWVMFMNFSIEPNALFILKIPFPAKQYIWCPAWGLNSSCSVPNAPVCHIQLAKMSALPDLCFQVDTPLVFTSFTLFWGSRRKLWLVNSSSLQDLREGVLSYSLTAGAKWAELEAFDLWFESVCLHSLFCCLTVSFPPTASPRPPETDTSPCTVAL